MDVGNEIYFNSIMNHQQESLFLTRYRWKSGCLATVRTHCTLLLEVVLYVCVCARMPGVLYGGVVACLKCCCCGNKNQNWGWLGIGVPVVERWLAVCLVLQAPKQGPSASMAHQ